LPASPPSPVDEAVLAAPRRTWVLAIAAAVAAGAIVGGVVGGFSGAAAGRDHGGTPVQPLTDPSIRLPVAEPSVVPAAGPGSVTAIATAVVPSVVTVQVRAPDARGTGAGVILTSDGYILTNNHVVAPTGSPGVLTVDLSNGRQRIAARVVGRSPLDDLAVIKIDVSGLPAARLGRSSTLRVGDLVVAVGAPLGLSGSVTSGIVSALARNVDVPSDESGQSGTVLGNAIQTDAAINPGNSGGALVDASGAVIGINSAIASLGESDTAQTGSIGVGFAIPIDYARSVAEEIIRTGTVTHPYLGVVPSTVDQDNPLPGGPDAGAYLRQVVSGSPAAKSGLRAGDVVVALDREPITSADDLFVAARDHKIGEVVTVTYIRAGARHQAQVTLGERPDN